MALVWVSLRKSVGLEQEAYDQAVAYARDRAQFGKKIIEFPAVYDMLSRMKAKLTEVALFYIRLHATLIFIRLSKTSHANANLRQKSVRN